MDHDDWSSEGYSIENEVECEHDEEERLERQEDRYNERRAITSEKRRFKNAVAVEVAKVLKESGISPTSPKPLVIPRGVKTEVKCKCCGDPFLARVADRKRGWAKFCSKSCKAKRQYRN